MAFPVTFIEAVYFDTWRQFRFRDTIADLVDS